MTDNPSPEMLQARADARRRVEDTHEIAIKALQDIRATDDVVCASKTLLGSAERAKLYANLAAAQDEYQRRLKEHADAFRAYHEHFQPISAEGGV